MDLDALRLIGQGLAGRVIAGEMSYPALHDGCWLAHDCPPILVKEAQVYTRNPVEAALSYVVFLLRSR
jgi:hypothetical protein